MTNVQSVDTGGVWEVTVNGEYVNPTTASVNTGHLIVTVPGMLYQLEKLIGPTVDPGSSQPWDIKGWIFGGNRSRPSTATAVLDSFEWNDRLLANCPT